MKNEEAINLTGCCGLYCRLCSKYQSKSPSRCIGCKLGEQHSWCSIWNCCVKKYGFKTCSECNEIFLCKIYVRRKVIEWIPAADNLNQIKKIGLKKWLEEQKQRQKLLETLLQNYNEGRSMSLYCKACSRMTIDLIKKASIEAKKKFADKEISKTDIKSKANILKATIKNYALKANINLV
ncbi:MAG: DUF3795 domain-containing protein [Actinobacteria bacterium]|nr:DUF3795 domain-containing protein [Actinomycetota bacterium]